MTALKALVPWSSVLLLLVGVATSASASAIYQYEGNPFTVTPGPFALGDRVTGSFTTNVPLGPGLDFTQIFPLDFEFMAGPVTFRKGDPDLLSWAIRVSTDANGDIVGPSDPTPNGWLVLMHGQPQPGSIPPLHLPSIESCARGDGLCGSAAEDKAALGPDRDSASVARNIDQPGTWSTIVVPEPSILCLFGLGLLGLALSRVSSAPSFGTSFAGAAWCRGLDSNQHVLWTPDPKDD